MRHREHARHPRLLIFPAKLHRADRTELTFSNHATDYTLFDYTDTDTQRAGVRVTLPNQTELEIACSGPVASRLSKLEGVLRCDPDNALSTGACR